MKRQTGWESTATPYTNSLKGNTAANKIILDNPWRRRRAGIASYAGPVTSNRDTIWTLSFGWQVAVVGFLGFNAAMGLDIMKNAYRSRYGAAASKSGRNANSEVAGHILNYLIQLAIVTVWGAYLAGMDEERVQKIRIHLTPGSTTVVTNWGMIFFGVSIFLWNKLFSDTPLLRQFCIEIMDKPWCQPLEQRNDPKTQPH
jgi:hypothetical protein